MKNEIIRKPMMQGKVEVNLLKSGHCYLQQVTTRYRQFSFKNIKVFFL